MIVLTVLSYSGVPAEGLSARFDELGGSIGRADNNQLVLPDPERSISRLHARVVFRGGQYAIVDNGSNPVGVNGALVPPGREQIIQPGDQVQIGSYLLTVSQADAAKSSNPFADLFGDGAQGLAGPVAPPPASTWAAPPMSSGGNPQRPYAADPAPSAMPPMRASAAPSGVAPPAWGAAAAPPAWGATPSPAPWPAASPAPASPARPGPAAAASLLADDWDFLADSGRAGAGAGGSAGARDDFAGLGGSAGSASSALGLSLGPGATDSLDDLFGLSKGAPAGDPLGAAPAKALLLQPNTSGHGDPLQALLRPAADVGASVADHGSELNTPMPLPRAASTAPTAPAGLPSGAIFSWDDPPRDGRHVTLPGRPRTEAAPTPASTSAATPAPTGAPLDDALFGALFDPPVNPVSSARPDPLVDPLADLLPGVSGASDSWLPAAPTSTPVPAPVPMSVPAPAPLSATAPSAATSTAHAAGDEALLQALRQGLGVPGLRLDTLSPALMLLIGQLLRESTRGAVELLVARAALKREMRAQLTVIQTRENNPLKFSPSVDVALQHLLAPPTQGFMAPAPAVRDAFDDLRAHQLGVMAGMKAALDGVLQRFDPQQLEGKLSKRSANDSLIPATRKARLWESFQQLFSQLSSEAQDDFDELFGKAFLRAYEAQLDRLQAEPGPR